MIRRGGGKFDQNNHVFPIPSECSGKMALNFRRFSRGHGRLKNSVVSMENLFEERETRKTGWNRAQSVELLDFRDAVTSNFKSCLQFGYLGPLTPSYLDVKHILFSSLVVLKRLPG